MFFVNSGAALGRVAPSTSTSTRAVGGDEPGSFNPQTQLLFVGGFRLKTGVFREKLNLKTRQTTSIVRANSGDREKAVCEDLVVIAFVLSENEPAKVTQF